MSSASGLRAYKRREPAVESSWHDRDDQQEQTQIRWTLVSPGRARSATTCETVEAEPERRLYGLRQQP